MFNMFNNNRDISHVHDHKKYIIKIGASDNKRIIMLPEGEYYQLSSRIGDETSTQDSILVYVNGILQWNGINFDEITDSNKEYGIGINISEDLIIGDVVALEWVYIEKQEVDE